MRSRIGRPTGPIYNTDVAGITSLIVNMRNITSLKGIEHFVAMTYFEARDNQLTELDVSNNTALIAFDVRSNQLTELDVSNNRLLGRIGVSSNQLTELDVSNNKELAVLEVERNQLTELDISNNAVLTSLWADDNQLTELDVSNNTALARLHVNNNQLTELDVSSNTVLENLFVGNNQLTELDVSNNRLLTGLSAHLNQLTELDVSNNAALTQLFVRENFMVVPDDVLGWRDIFDYVQPEGSPGVHGFRFWPQRTAPPTDITADFTCPNFLAAVREWIGTYPIYNTNVAGVEFLVAQERGITSLAGIEHFAALSVLWVGGNQLTELDMSNNVELTELRIGNNQLTELDVSNNRLLTLLDVWDNQLTELDVSNNGLLTELAASENQLTELNLPNNGLLTVLVVNDNQLTELDVSNNTAMTRLDVGQNQLFEIDVSNITVLETLDVSFNRLTELDVSNNTALTSLVVLNNRLTELDVSNNTLLTELFVGAPLEMFIELPFDIDMQNNAALTELDVSNNTVLEWLFVYGNQLTALDLSYNTNLFRVDVRQNNFTGLGEWPPHGLPLLPEDTDWLELEWDEPGFHFWPQRTAPPTDITADFTCPNFLAAVREIIIRPYPQRIYLSDVNTRAVLDVADRYITNLSGIEHFTALTWLSAANNRLTELDISANTVLTSLQVINNQLTEFDVTSNTALTWLNVADNRLTAFDVSANTALDMLHVSGNYLTELDVSHNTVLRVLTARDNLLSELDVSANLALGTLNVENNYLTELDMSHNTALDWLVVRSNRLTSLDVSNNAELEHLDVRENFMVVPDDVLGWRDIFDYVEPEGSTEFERFHFNPQRDSVREIEVFPDSIVMPPGDTKQFTASVITSGNASTAVIWTVEGSNAAGTMISANGLLTVAGDETARSLTVRATSDIDASVCGTAAVTVEGGKLIPPAGATLAISTTFANAGGRATVQIRMDDNPGFAAMALRLSFHEYLTLTSYELGRPNLPAEVLADLGYRFDGPIIGNEDSFMGWVGRTSDINLNGVLLTLTFEVGPGAEFGDFLPIEIFFESYVGPEMPENAAKEELDNIGIRNGGVRIEPYIIGDANGNGRVTSGDGTVLARHLAGHGVTIDLRGMDLNLDGYVDGIDLIRLAEWLLGRGVPPAARQ